MVTGISLQAPLADTDGGPVQRTVRAGEREQQAREHHAEVEGPTLNFALSGVGVWRLGREANNFLKVYAERWEV